MKAKHRLCKGVSTARPRPRHDNHARGLFQMCFGFLPQSTIHMPLPLRLSDSFAMPSHCTSSWHSVQKILLPFPLSLPPFLSHAAARRPLSLHSTTSMNMITQETADCRVNILRGDAFLSDVHWQLHLDLKWVSLQLQQNIFCTASTTL